MDRREGGEIWSVCAHTLPGILVLLGIGLTRLHSSYLLFHCLAEVFGIIVACGIFMVAWNSRRFLDNNCLLLLGIAYAFVAVIDLLHTLAYEGMPIFLGGQSNRATQFWISARYLESLSLLVAPLFLRRRLFARLAWAAYVVVTGLLVAAVFAGLLPDCFVPGEGLTAFKKASEYVISAILLASAILLVHRRDEFERRVLLLLVSSIALTIASEMAFTLYKSVSGSANTIGHLLKVVSFYLIYKAVIEMGLERPYDVLFRDLKQHEVQLQRHADELEQRNEEIKDFAYAVSHDLRAPLASLLGFVSHLRGAWGHVCALLHDAQPQAHKALTEEIPEAIGFIESSATRMDRYVNALLELARVGRRELVLEQVDMDAAVRETLDTLAHHIEERQAATVVDPLPDVLADRTAMAQIVGNLLTNAVIYLDPRRPGRVEITAEQTDDETIFRVRDNGRGIAERDMPDVFAPHRRGRNADVPGEGMGLAHVQALVRAHRGRIWCESEPGAGATFSFSIPRRRPPDAP